MEDRRDQLVEAIQTSGYKATLVVTGGGSGAVNALLAHPGASRFLLEAQVPYCPAAMRDYLGEDPESYCSEAAAQLMAERAYERTMIFTLPQGDASPIMGIACTAALQTIRERKGSDRAYLAIKTRKVEKTRRLDLAPGTRRAQEELVTAALLEFIAEFLGVGE